jgi:hypothetical protein
LRIAECAWLLAGRDWGIKNSKIFDIKLHKMGAVLEFTTKGLPLTFDKSKILTMRKEYNFSNIFLMQSP